VTNITRERIAGACLILGTFFNPLGFDALYVLTVRLTGSYWAASLCFYLLSGTFFAIWWRLSRKKKNR
jgi:membrane protein implicated in regulation of membrane protease activity